MKNKRSIVSLITILFIMMFFGTIVNSRSLNSNISPKTSQEELISVNFPIHIKDNWSETVALYDWCSGNGTESNPYIIENINVTNKNQTAHISIETAEYFIIRNCKVSNYAKPYGHHIFAGIYIEKGEYGLIENCTIINCSIGISFYEAKDDIKIINNIFIGSHDNNETGRGAAIRIQEAKGVNISYNDIFNYYDGIVVRDAEEIYIENNRIETSFKTISHTGIYFYTVSDSTIINNDFYGCTFDGHEYSNPFPLTNGLATSFTNCFNIIVYGNRFFDLDGNLIVDESDEIPDDDEDQILVSSTSTNHYWIFILIIFMSFICICIFSYLLKKQRVEINNKKIDN